jgi:hypothetical protein
MSGRCILAGMALLLVLLVPLLAPPAAAQGSGSLTRGNTFTVTVIGRSRTPYDIWVSGTHDMTGKPGDQPPIIVPGQVDVEQDPPGGPYVIGSTPISGSGRTILEDVAPSTPEVPSTSYYARVTTDASGHRAVLFQTSFTTATDREFHIVAQNPADPGKEVQVVLGLPAPVQTPVIPPPLPTTMQTPIMPSPTTAATTPLMTSIPATTMNGTPPITEIPAGTTPVQEVPLPGLIGILATGFMFLFSGRRTGGGG